LARGLTTEEARGLFAQMLGGRQPTLVAKFLDGDPLANAKVEIIQERTAAEQTATKPRLKESENGKIRTTPRTK
jgi:hypothetical protein